MFFKIMHHYSTHLNDIKMISFMTIVALYLHTVDIIITAPGSFFMKIMTALFSCYTVIHPYYRGSSRVDCYRDDVKIHCYPKKTLVLIKNTCLKKSFNFLTNTPFS